MEKEIVEKIGFIDEERYQLLKQLLNKNNEYFSYDELNRLRQNYAKIQKKSFG